MNPRRTSRHRTPYCRATKELLTRNAGVSHGPRCADCIALAHNHIGWGASCLGSTRVDTTPTGKCEWIWAAIGVKIWAWHIHLPSTVSGGNVHQRLDGSNQCTGPYNVGRLENAWCELSRPFPTRCSDVLNIPLSRLTLPLKWPNHRRADKVTVRDEH